ncbi:MAG: hypothetical protein WC101_02140 [Candidatus Gracilibacteria bacterium]
MKDLKPQHTEAQAAQDAPLSARLRESAKNTAISAGRVAVRYSIKGICLLSGLALLGPEDIASRSPIIIARDALKPLLDGDGGTGSLYYAMSIDDGYEFKDRVDKTMRECEELVATEADPEMTLQLLKAIEKVIVHKRIPTAKDIRVALDIINRPSEKPLTICNCYASEDDTQRGGTVYGCTATGDREIRSFEAYINSHGNLRGAVVSLNGTHKFLSAGNISPHQESDVRWRFMDFLNATGCQKNDECDQVVVTRDLRLGKKSEQRLMLDDSGRWVRPISYKETHWWSQKDPHGYPKGDVDL